MKLKLFLAIFSIVIGIAGGVGVGSIAIRIYYSPMLDLIITSFVSLFIFLGLIKLFDRWL